MKKLKIAAAPPRGSYHRIPYFALRGMFQVRGYQDQEVAQAIGISPSTLSTKMQGHSAWTSCEIAAICELLEIQQKDIGKLFFPQAAQQKGA